MKFTLTRPDITDIIDALEYLALDAPEEDKPRLLKLAEKVHRQTKGKND